jgi:lysine 2,3-aminomutase
VSSTAKQRSAWRDVPSEQWNDLRWQLSNLVRTTDELGALLGLPERELSAIRAQSQRFRWAISPYYFSLIDPSDPSDPIRRMVVPSADEDTSEGEDDPLGEKRDQVAPGLTHRYPDRVLFVVTSFCSSYCRFCIRKRNWRHSDAARSRAEIDEAIAYLRAHEEVRDVLISGGDPLTLPHEQLEYILSQVRSVPHVELVRIGSREPVMLPMRVDDALLRLLDRHAPLWINTHFNHPRELTEEAARAAEKLARLGIPLGNQTVLLAGVNDDLPTLKALFQGLLRIRVRPYYLYQADPVVGAMHLRTSVERGIELIEGLRGHTTGLAVPTFVVDAPGGGGKIPVGPEYVVERRDGAIVLRNYAGETFVYKDPTMTAKSPRKRALPLIPTAAERDGE